MKLDINVLYLPVVDLSPYIFRLKSVTVQTRKLWHLFCRIQVAWRNLECDTTLKIDSDRPCIDRFHL